MALRSSIDAGWVVTAVLLLVGCSGPDGSAFPDEMGTGGAAGFGGVAGTGGPIASGGVNGSGAVSGSGAASGAGSGSGGARANGSGGVSAGGAVSGSGGAGAGGKLGGNGGAIGSGGVAAGGAMNGSGGAGAGGMTGGNGGNIGSGGTTGSGGMSGGGTSGTGGVAPVPTVEQLFPLAVGNVWNYRVTVLPGTQGTSPCAAGMRATTITGRAMISGENAFTATHVCAPMATRYYVENAKGLEVNLGSSWSLVLPRPISDGAVFMSASSSQVIARVANITVPAGTFSNCWQTGYVTATGPETTYCAGVGLVTLEYQAPSGGGYRLDLVSYMLK